MGAAYRLFERQWKRGKVTEAQLDRAVELGYISVEEKTEIMQLEQEDAD